MLVCLYFLLPFKFEMALSHYIVLLFFPFYLLQCHSVPLFSFYLTLLLRVLFCCDSRYLLCTTNLIHVIKFTTLSCYFVHVWGLLPYKLQLNISQCNSSGHWSTELCTTAAAIKSQGKGEKPPLRTKEGSSFYNGAERKRNEGNNNSNMLQSKENIERNNIEWEQSIINYPRIRFLAKDS